MRWMGLILLFWMIPLGLAQDASKPGVFEITYNATVRDSITNEAVFDWWKFNGKAGDVVGVEMFASEGLAPLLGLMDTDGNIIARSDEEGRIEPPDGQAVLQFTLESDGQYTIIATRVDHQSGDTEGQYELRLHQLNGDMGRANPLLAVEFRCKDALATSVLAVEINEKPKVPDENGMTQFYRVTVYGLDGFMPIVQVKARVIGPGVDPTISDSPLDCTRDAQNMVGDQIILPDGQEIIVTEESLDHMAQLSIRNTSEVSSLEEITFLIGNVASSGRYIAVLEGLNLAEGQERDDLDVQLGPLTLEQPLQVYVIADQNSRLDPSLKWYDPESHEEMAMCDDAGSKVCPEVASIDKAFIMLDERQWKANRFDAGLNLTAKDSKAQLVEISSSGGKTKGAYIVVFIGAVNNAP
ncbi:hypothetical protein MASR2M15_10060 [Anaerolineales bacterium]